MDRLWTPWRAAFVERVPDATTRQEGCFLCTGPAAHDDRANLIVFRAKSAFVVLNRYPYNTGHVMVAPYVHSGDLAGLDATIASDLMARRSVVSTSFSVPIIPTPSMSA